MNELERIKQEERKDLIFTLKRIALVYGYWVLIVLVFIGVMLWLSR